MERKLYISIILFAILLPSLANMLLNQSLYIDNIYNGTIQAGTRDNPYIRLEVAMNNYNFSSADITVIYMMGSIELNSSIYFSNGNIVLTYGNYIDI